MRVYIQSINGEPWNDECRIAMNGFSSLGAECIPFSNIDELEGIKTDEIVVAGTLVTHHVFNMFGYDADNFSYPDDLKEFYGREIRRIKADDINSVDLPFFVKPVKDKLAKGVAAYKYSDMEEYLTLPKDTELLCCEVVNFVSEWRCFVADNKILGMKHYAGDEKYVCDENVVKSALAAYRNSPAGYAIDFGVTDDGRTLVVEVNDGFALGAYGLQPELYCRLLAARWRELAHSEFDRMCPIINRKISETDCYEYRVGCVDSAPYKYYSKYNSGEMRAICSTCKYCVDF